MSRGRFDAVVIGGGIHGCSTLFNLTKQGIKNVALLEKDSISSGATGRSGAGIRQQFGTEINCRLMLACMDLLENLNDILDYGGDLELKQGGYTLLSYTETSMEQYRKNIELQNSLGIESELLTPDQLADLVPGLNLDGLVAGTYNAKDGTINPFRATYAYAAAAQRSGAKIFEDTKVLQIEKGTGCRWLIKTNDGDFETDVIVDAAGPFAGDIGRMVGLDLPIAPERHELLVTEPINPVLRPLIISLKDRLYFQQTKHGSFLIGQGEAEPVKGTDSLDSWEFLFDVVAKAARLFPILGKVRVVRQWAGSYDITPDSQAIISGVEGIKGFFIDAGWSGHGFMFGPIIGELMAQLIVGKTPRISIDKYNYGRFARKELIPEPYCV